MCPFVSRRSNSGLKCLLSEIASNLKTGVKEYQVFKFGFYIFMYVSNVFYLVMLLLKFIFGYRGVNGRF
ncbi:hypothetical protein RJT34_29246 [Clitoria ternatea]|uniref:Uncharacterized protein n=1 Tax=Clitoria ternatea TaxID=43366 RepID=A0AAN9FIL3_CLITE